MQWLTVRYRFYDPHLRRWRVAQAETVWRGRRPLRRSWLRREVFPSIAMTSGKFARSLSTQARKQALNKSGSMAAITSHDGSRLGCLSP
jgi:hypothetical protein